MKRLALIASAVVGISACGGGSDSGPATESVSVGQATAPLSGPLQGFIAIEERAGKRIFDGWFSRGSIAEQAGVVLWQENAERCVGTLGNASPDAGDRTLVGTRWQETLDAGDEIRIQSRGGDVVTMQAQRYGNGVVYASSERWLAQALPDDAQLSVTGSDKFPSFGPVALMPLTPLVSSQPADGYSTDVAQPVLWDASIDATDEIQLTVSAFSGDTGMPSQDVKCWLQDSGQFVLPTSVVQHFPDNPQLIYTLVRTRHAVHESEGATLQITQSSYP